MPFTVNLNKATIKVQIESQSEPIMTLEQVRQHVHQLASELLEYWMGAQQETCLHRDLGACWRRVEPYQVACACPKCGSPHVRRKSWKPRRITVAGFGTCWLGRRQLSCVACGTCWMPYEQALELPSGAFDRRSLAHGVDRVVDQSYKKAADACPAGPSASTIHRSVQRFSAPEVSREAGTVVVDGTRVPAWKKPGQITVSVLHEIGAKETPASKDQPPVKRPRRRQRRILGAVGGKEADLIPWLDPLKAHALVHDGNLKLDGQATHVGRCRWHVPHTTQYLLYRNQIRGEDNIRRVERLKNGIERYKYAPSKLTKHLDTWIAAYKDAPVAATHVQNSKEALLTMSRYPEAFTTLTTSHLEREMVEINKRFENGGGWTPKGATSLLWLHQLHRFEPEKYKQTRDDFLTHVAFSNNRNSLS